MKFLDLLDDFGWRNIVCGSTHVKGGTLDLVLTQCQRDDHLELSDVKVLPVPVVPDHYLVTWESNITNHIQSGGKVIHCRNMKEISEEDLIERIKASDLCRELPEDLDDCAKLYDSTLRDILDELAPLEERTIKNSDRAKWWTAECQEVKRLRRAAERRWQTSLLKSADLERLTRTFTEWKKACKHAAKVINDTRNNYYKTRLDQVSGDGKATAGIVDKLLGNEKTPSTLPSGQDPAILATRFNEFFSAKVTKIYKDIEDQPVTPPVVEVTLASPSCHLSDFKPVSDEELWKIIQSMPKKHCSLDAVPSTMVSAALSELLPSISKIVNGSLLSGTVPDSFKEAVVRPSYKGKGLDPEDPGSYRPISNLSFVSKIVEKCVSLQLTEYLENNKLLPRVQSAYRKFHSCETATLKIVNDVALLLDKKSKVILLLLDLSAAFDTVKHSTLLRKLETQYGIGGTALDWFRSYLCNRRTSVMVDGERSSSIDVDIGVPQGSILGPLLFIMYTRELQAIAEMYGLYIHLFADDTQIYTEFNTGTYDAVVTNLQKCFSHIQSWMKDNYLKLNAGKTEVIILQNSNDDTPGPRDVQLQPDKEALVPVSKAAVTPATSARNLGIWFDPLLSMGDNISNIVKACNIQMVDLWRIGNKLAKPLKIQLVHSLIHSRLDYGNALLYGAVGKDLDRLQKIQNSATRFIYGTKKWRGVTQMRKELHFLPVRSRINFRICLLTYKALHGLAPPYLMDLISTRPQDHHPLRDSTKLHLPKHTYTSTEKAFSICAPIVWNELPRKLRESESLPVFKTLLKTYLFNLAYS